MVSKSHSLNLSIMKKTGTISKKNLQRIKEGKRVKKPLFVIGVVVLTVGILLAAFGTRQVPYTDYETYSAQNSTVIVNEASKISNNDYYAYYRDFDAGEQLKIEFSAVSDLSIWVENEDEYYKFTSSQSHSGIWAALDVTSAEATVTIPNDDYYYVVILNENTHSVEYDLKVTEYWTSLETREIIRYRPDYTLNFVGVAIVFAGVILTVVGAVTKPSDLEDYEDDEELSTLQPTPIITTADTDGETELLEVMEKVPSEIICPNCASEIDAETTFCPYCGSKL